MIFKTLKIENFMLISHAEINFETGLTSIEGQNLDFANVQSNFSGKSTLPDAVSFCWYGQTTRNISPQDVVNVRSKRDCCVRNTFEKDGHDYEIIRTRNHGNYSTGSVKIIMDGQDITPALKPQGLIDKILGNVPFNIFTQVCVFSQGNRFRFIELPNSEQKAILESLIDFKRFEKYREIIKDDLSDLTDRYTKAKEERITFETQLKSLEEENERLESWLVMAEKQGSLTKKERKEIELRFEEIEKEREELKKVDEALSDEIGKYNDKVDSLKERFKLLETDLEKNKKKQEKFTKLLDVPKCPTCKQPVSRDFIRKLLQKLQTNAAVYKNKYAELKKEQEILHKQRLIFTPKVSAWGKAKSDLDFESKKLSKKLACASADTETYKKRLEEIVEEKKEAANNKTFTEQEVFKCENRSKYYDFLDTAFSRDGIESYLLDTILPFLNERAGYYSEQLSDGRIKVSFATLKKLKRKDTFKDTFNVQISAEDGAGTYTGCSGSEMRIADLSVALAIRDLAEVSGRSIPPLLFLDEITDTMDPSMAAKVIQFFKKFSKDKVVWIISHISENKQLFDRKLIVVRLGGNSTVKKDV